VIARFCDDFGVSFKDAEEVYIETLRWLWLCAYRLSDYQQGKVDTPRMPLASQAQVIDLMWHTFLLFSKDYSEFCETHFGFLLHHFPLSRADKAQLAEELATDPEAFREKRVAQLEPVYSYIYDVLGPEVLVRWMEEFPERYSNLKALALR
jgi:hypothetical protein